MYNSQDIVALQNFSPSEFTFNTEFASSGYKRIQNRNYDLEFLHVESRLSRKALSNFSTFSQYEIYHLLNQPILVILNMFPHDYVSKAFNFNPKNLYSNDIFQPLELLQGQSIADFNICSP